MSKIIFSLGLTAILFAQASFADKSVTLEGVHMCCKSCEKGIAKAVSSVSGASCETDQDLEEVTISAPNKKALSKSVSAMVKAGYFGTSSDSSVKVKSESGAKNKMVDSMTVEGIHLCCGKCVSTVNEALSGVKGVEGNTAEKKLDHFEITGRFNAKEVFDALNEYGLGGTVAK